MVLLGIIIVNVLNTNVSNTSPVALLGSIIIFLKYYLFWNMELRDCFIILKDILKDRRRKKYLNCV